MSKPAAIEGAFADLRVIKTRSVVQIVVEVPIEHADAALEALGGVPQPGAERRVAIARLVELQTQKPQPNIAKSIDAKERYANADEMRQAVTRAVMLCKNKAFQAFLGAHGEGEARLFLGGRCGVDSRRQIGIKQDAYRAFLNIEQQFRTSQQVAGYPSHWTGAA